MTEERPALTADEERIKDEGLILILKELHERLDALVFQAYGWPETLTDEQIWRSSSRLIMNAWRRKSAGSCAGCAPITRSHASGSRRIAKPRPRKARRLPLALAIDAPKRKPSFPASAVEQTAAVFSALANARGPVDAAAIASGFKGRNVEKKVAGVLTSLARLGHLATKDGRSFKVRGVA